MEHSNPLSLSQLAEYLQSNKNFKPLTNLDFEKLRNMGYYHGYKGYRYISSPSNPIPYESFDELLSIYEFDKGLKSLFYPKVMEIETAQKNRVLEVILEKSSSADFSVIYSNLFDSYKEYKYDSRAYKKRFKQTLDLRSFFYKIQADSYDKNNRIATHFLQNRGSLPIWAIFELITLGQFANFVRCLNKGCRKEVSKSFNIKHSDDTNFLLPQRLIYLTKDLRNSIAHNDIIFDTRFNTSSIDGQVASAIKNKLGIDNINWHSITAFLIAIVYQLSLFNFPNSYIVQMICDFDALTEELRNNIPTSIYNQIIFSDKKPKIEQLKKYFAT